jgi:hypothetical protein
MTAQLRKKRSRTGPHLLTAEMRTKLHTFVRAALAHLRANYRPPQRYYVHTEISGNGSSDIPRLRIDPLRLLETAEQGLSVLPEFQAAWSALDDSPETSRILGTRERRVRRVLSDYLWVHRSLRYNQRRLDARLPIFSRLWSTLTTEVELAAPIRGIEAPSQPVELGPGVVLLPFRDTQKNSFWNKFDLSPHGFQSLDLLSCATLLVIAEKIPAEWFARGNLTPIIRAADDLCADAVTALRLSCTGEVGALTIRRRYLPSPRDSFFYDDAGSAQPARELATTGYADARFKNEHRRRAKKAFALLTTLRHSGKYDQIGVPLLRFNQSYGRSSPEDAVVDLVIALEGSALFGYANELGYRLRLRVLRLLRPFGLQYDEAIRTLYPVRSDIVHSGASVAKALARQYNKKPAPWADAQAFVAAARAAVREVLWHYLVEYAAVPDLSAINASLDRDIIAGIASGP